MGSFTPAVPSSAPVYSFPTHFPFQLAGNHPRRSAGRGNSPSRRSRVRFGPRNRILMFGSIRELALYRAEVLRAHGFNVATPQSKTEAIASIRRGGYDVVVLSYTLSNDTVEEIAELVRQHCPDCRLITISDTKYRDTKISPDANVLADEGPKALIEALRTIVKQG